MEDGEPLPPGLPGECGEQSGLAGSGVACQFHDDRPAVAGRPDELCQPRQLGSADGDDGVRPGDGGGDAHVAGPLPPVCIPALSTLRDTQQLWPSPG